MLPVFGNNMEAFPESDHEDDPCGSDCVATLKTVAVMNDDIGDSGGLERNNGDDACFSCCHVIDRGDTEYDDLNEEED
jgi:hypothetical protein